MVHLFRIQSGESRVLAPWLQEALDADGGANARGRWFTDRPETLAFYLADTPSPQLWRLTVSSDLVETWRVSRLPMCLEDGTRPRAFSRAPEEECFVPRAEADRAQRMPWRNSPALRQRGLGPR